MMQAFSESVSFDSLLAEYDIACSLAHAGMLKEIGLLKAGDFRKIERGLKRILKEIQSGSFSWDPALEDVHMNIERALTADVPEASRLHTGRSRNDQVATDMRLFFKDAIQRAEDHLLEVLKGLHALSEKALKAEIIIPGYTHLQRAQPVPMAHHLNAYLEMFSRDYERVKALYDQANWCPLGSGALAGSTLPLNREMVAESLGFVDRKGRPRVTHNSMDTVADRDLFLDFAHVASTSALHLSRIAEDMILWNSAEFQYIRLPDAFTTGSSLMPQKKNPDALELIRGKAGRIVGHQHALQMMVKGLPLTYNRDLQEDKPPIFDIDAQWNQCLVIFAQQCPGIEFLKEKTEAAVADPMLLATDLADFLVEHEVPFREAHHQVGALVKLSEDCKVPLPELSEEMLGSLEFTLPEGWKDVFSVSRSLRRREGTGMAGWKAVRQEHQRWGRWLSQR